MIRGKVTVEDNDRGFRDFQKRIREDVTEVKVGVQSDEDETLLIIATANEFGATINHPGGTAYGYQTPADAKKGRVKFLKAGQGYKVLGFTKPHKITLPARPYIRSTVDENQDQYNAMIEALHGQVVDGNTTKFEAFEQIGLAVEADIKRKITTLRNPANKPSTIKKKGSDNPLIDEGHLRASIRYAVT